MFPYLTKRREGEEGNVSSQELHFFYDSQSKPAFVEFEGERYRYVHSLQGDIIAIVDSAGNIEVEYKYDAWGMLVHAVAANDDLLASINPFGYRGYIYENEFKSYYLRSRWYSCIVCRFINEDILVSSAAYFVGLNMFAYALNNPVCGKDSSGKRPIMAMSVQHENSTDRKKAMESMKPSKNLPKTYLKAMPKFEYAPESIVKQIDDFLARSNMKRLTDVTVVNRDGNTYYACHYGGMMQRSWFPRLKTYERVVALFAVEDYESEMTYGDAFSLGMFMISGGAAYMGDMKSEMGQSARAFEYIQGAADVADEIGIGSFGMKPIISGTAVRLVEGHFWDE